MKYYYNKAQPNIEYGMLSSRYLNNPKRKPNADCLVTYYYTSVSEPLGGTYYRNRDYYIIPVKVTPKVYAQLMKRDKKEHNNNHKHDRRYLDVENITVSAVKSTRMTEKQMLGNALRTRKR